MIVELHTGMQVDRYEVVGLIGAGGMASVHHVRHTRLGSDHVLKVLTLSGRAIRERLLLEGQVQAKLKHRNVVEVTDVIDIQGAPGLVMELVRGPSLDAILTDDVLPLELVDALAAGILAGVAAAHAEGVVHRDLKPANILLATHRGQVVPKVADFGLVKVLADGDGDVASRTRTNATMGTPNYMAPEQIQSAKDVDARADVFALGAILYELATGHRAFDGDSAFEVFNRVVAREHRPLRELRPELPDRMVDAVARALEDRDTRPPTVEALWALWSGGSEPLEAAASRAAVWPDALVVRLRELTPSALPTTGSSVPSQPTADGSNVTFAATSVLAATEVPTAETLPASAPASSPPTDPGSRRLVLGALGGGVAGVVLTGLVGVLAVVVVVGVLWSSAGGQARVDVDLQAQPVPPSPDPSPPPDPPVSTEPLPEPIATEPEPAALEPTPVPAGPPPVPSTPSIPRPARGTPAAPTGTVKVTGDALSVHLERDGARVAPGSVPPGRYQVMAEFPRSGVTSQGFLVVVEGGTHTIACARSMSNCSLQ